MSFACFPFFATEENEEKERTTEAGFAESLKGWAFIVSYYEINSYNLCNKKTSIKNKEKQDCITEDHRDEREKLKSEYPRSNTEYRTRKLTAWA